jgi:replicative DNA helicase
MVTITPDLVVLARMLYGGQDAAERLAELVDPAGFQSKASRHLFLLFAREASRGFSPITIQTVVAAEAPQCAPLLQTIVDGPFASVTAFEDASHESLAESLVQWGQMERLKRAAGNVQKSFDAGAPYTEVRSTLDRQLSAIDVTALTDRAYDDKQDMARRVQDFMTGGVAAGLPFGFTRLDKKVTPMLPGNFVVVAGRPGVGKTTVQKNICRNAVKQYEEQTAYFTFEMMGDEILPSFACMDAGLSYVRYIRQEFNAWEIKRFNEAMQFWVDSSSFKLNERSAVTPDWILRTMKRYRAEGVTLFFIDHLHRVQYEANGKGDIRLAIGNFAQRLKSFAVDYGCKVVAGAQLTKGDKHEEPGEEMIREANNILEEADKIILPWLPLVAGTRAGDGSFMPTILGSGRRLFAKEAPKGSDEGEDKERVYVKLGKMRVRDDDGFVAIPFNPESGLMYEDTQHEIAEYVA